MNKKLFTLLFFCAGDCLLLSMDGNALHTSANINSSRVRELLNQINAGELDQEITSKNSKVDEAVPEDDNVIGAKWTIQCPICPLVLCNNRSSAYLFKAFRNHVVSDIVLCSPLLQVKINEIFEQCKLGCFKCFECGVSLSLLKQGTNWYAIYQHLADEHFQAILNRNGNMGPHTVKEFEDYCEQNYRNNGQKKVHKSKVRFIAEEKYLEKTEQKMRVISCQLCGVKINLDNRYLSEIKRRYLRHVVYDIVSRTKTLTKKDKTQCYICDKVVEKNSEKLKGYLYEHLANSHLEAVLEQGKDIITIEQIERHLQEAGIIVRVRKGCKSNPTNKHVANMSCLAEDPYYKDFVSKMDQMIASSDKPVLSIQEMAKRLEVSIQAIE